MEARKKHEVGVDRQEYVKKHCHDPDAESKVKKNEGEPPAPAYLSNGPVSKVYSLKDNYARPAKKSEFFPQDETKLRSRRSEGPVSKRGVPTSEAADNRARCTGQQFDFAEGRFFTNTAEQKSHLMKSYKHVTRDGHKRRNQHENKIMDQTRSNFSLAHE